MLGNTEPACLGGSQACGSSGCWMFLVFLVETTTEPHVNNFSSRGFEHSPDLRDWLPACHGSWVTRVFATHGSPSLGKRGESRSRRQSGGPSFEAHSYLTLTFYCCNRVQIARKSLIPLGFDLKGGISADMFARKAAKE